MPRSWLLNRTRVSRNDPINRAQAQKDPLKKVPDKMKNGEAQLIIIFFNLLNFHRTQAIKLLHLSHKSVGRYIRRLCLAYVKLWHSSFFFFFFVFDMCWRMGKPFFGKNNLISVFNFRIPVLFFFFSGFIKCFVTRWWAFYYSIEMDFYGYLILIGCFFFPLPGKGENEFCF